MTFATRDPHCARSDSDTQFVDCFTAPYAGGDAVLSRLRAAFRSAGVPVAGASCSSIDGLVETCDVWSTRSEWHARATFTSNVRPMTASELTRARAQGESLAQALAREPHEPWTGVVAVSRFR